tara:strand:- start:141 stop:827 length:687 start_codon:yes stop_codon:yes gene_type:complete
MFKIVGSPDGYEHKDVLYKLIRQFMPFAQKNLGFDKPVDINLLSDPENARNPLGKTAFYDPNMMKVTLFVDGRHVKDIMRSLSHEMVHHTQNCQGKFASGMNTKPGYAQNNDHLRKCEKQAYLLGNIRFRDWEDGIKQQQENKQMKSKSLINEIVEIIHEEFAELEEGHVCEEIHPNISHREWGETNENLDEYLGAGLHPEETNENWFKGDKDQLLFEELTRKWTKKR